MASLDAPRTGGIDRRGIERWRIAGGCSMTLLGEHQRLNVQFTSLGLMTEETIIALKNYDWLVRNKGLDEVGLHWESDSLVSGDGGYEISLLTDPGFTPGTRQES
ncbi:hypothetical protein [Streptomyces sp. NPDC005046]